MINQLLKDIAMESSRESETDLMVERVDASDIKEAFLDAEDGAGENLSETDIRKLIDKIPETKDDLSDEQVSQLAENFMVLVEEDSIFESAGADLGHQIATLEHVSVTLSNRLLGNPDDVEARRALKEVNGKISFLETVRESQENAKYREGEPTMRDFCLESDLEELDDITVEGIDLDDEDIEDIDDVSESIDDIDNVELDDIAESFDFDCYL